MLFPLRDENPLARPPIATIVLIGCNVAAWVFLQGLGTDPGLSVSVCQFGLIPGDLLGGLSGAAGAAGAPRVCPPGGWSESYFSAISSMFMHGGWFHLIGNMWFLWVFGDNVEDSMGPVRFVLFYVLCGLGAAAAQTLTEPSSVIPMVGASGAIGGVMGAYALLYPRARIISLLLVVTVSLPAWLMLGYWVLVQVAGSFQVGGGGGVAFWAHLGGFGAGLALVMLFRDPKLLRDHLRQGPPAMARYRLM